MKCGEQASVLIPKNAERYYCSGAVIYDEVRFYVNGVVLKEVEFTPTSMPGEFEFEPSDFAGSVPVSALAIVRSTPGFAGAAQGKELRKRGLACGCWT